MVHVVQGKAGYCRRVMITPVERKLHVHVQTMCVIKSMTTTRKNNNSSNNNKKQQHQYQEKHPRWRTMERYRHNEGPTWPSATRGRFTKKPTPTPPLPTPTQQQFLRSSTAYATITFSTTTATTTTTTTTTTILLLQTTMKYSIFG